MRTCGNCGWTRDSEGYSDFCLAAPGRECLPVTRVCPACTLWKPRKDWRGETCGPCEFLRGAKFRCRRSGPNAKAVYTRDPACAEWMPKEGEE